VTAREWCALFQVDLDSGKSCSKIAWTAGIASANSPREAFSGVSASNPRDPITKYPSNLVPIVTGISVPEYARWAPFLVAVPANGLEELSRTPVSRLERRSRVFFRSDMSKFPFQSNARTKGGDVGMAIDVAGLSPAF
jgi:hypothetical protein